MVNKAVMDLIEEIESLDWGGRDECPFQIIYSPNQQGDIIQIQAKPPIIDGDLYKLMSKAHIDTVMMKGDLIIFEIETRTHLDPEVNPAIWDYGDEDDEEEDEEEEKEDLE